MCVFLSTSRLVRKEMRDWVVTDEGDRWTVKLDVRDLGGHLDTTFRGWSSTLAARVRLVAARCLCFASSFSWWDDCSSGICLFLVLCMVLRLLFWLSPVFESCGLLFARCPGLVDSLWLMWVLSLLDGPVGCDPAFCVVWFRFRLMRRYLAYKPEEVSRVYRLLAAAAEGCSGHGPAHLLVESADEIGFSWCSGSHGWSRPGLPLLCMLAGPIQHFRSAILDAWRHRVSMSLCSREGFRGGPFF